MYPTPLDPRALILSTDDTPSPVPATGPTEWGLLRDVLVDPTNLDARLLYADWQEEYGGQPLRAEFIRVQVGLGRYGPPRIRLEDKLLIPQGPDYWLMSANTYGDERLVKVGSRVDVLSHDRRGRKAKEWLYGLLVTKNVVDDPLDAGDWVLKRDQYSVPYPTDLDKRGRELFADRTARGNTGLLVAETDGVFSVRVWDKDWTVQPRVTIYDYAPGLQQDDNFRWRFWWRNGFGYRVECSAEGWEQWGPMLCGAHPVTSLRLMDRKAAEWLEPVGPSYFTVPDDTNIRPWGATLWHPSEKAALFADAQNALNWARAQNGLPPITMEGGTSDA